MLKGYYYADEKGCSDMLKSSIIRIRNRIALTENDTSSSLLSFLSYGVNKKDPVRASAPLLLRKNLRRSYKETDGSHGQSHTG